jgi:hypothetical protein
MDNDNYKKPLVHGDENGFLFKQEILCDDTTHFIDIDNITYHPKRGWVVFEYLLCGEQQKWVTPHTSHPNNYWHLNKMKFVVLFKIVKLLRGEFFCINYAKSGTAHADKVGVIKIYELTPDKGITKAHQKNFTKLEFSKWFREINIESGSVNSNDIK